MKEKITHITVDDIEYPIMFDFNIICWLQNNYVSINAWYELISPTKDENNPDNEPKYEVILESIKEMINEGIDYENDCKNSNRKFLTTKQVGRILTSYGVVNAVAKLKQAMADSADSDDESKNE